MEERWSVSTGIARQCEDSSSPDDRQDGTIPASTWTRSRPSFGGAAKRIVVAGLVALALVGGSLVSGQDAAAYQRTHISKDGKVIMVCVYDDQTGKLRYCDVYYR